MVTRLRLIGLWKLGEMYNLLVVDSMLIGKYVTYFPISELNSVAARVNKISRDRMKA
jgi:hypothetical protein